MHILDQDIPKLEQAFKEMYNKDLIGESMG